MRSYISQSLCRKLQLPVERTNISIQGLNQTKSQVPLQTLIKIESMHSKLFANLPVLVIPKITEILPVNVNLKNISIPDAIINKSANPHFEKKCKIDILLMARSHDSSIVDQVQIDQQKRNRLGASETLLKELALEDKEAYRNHLRMSEEKFDELLLKIKNHVKKQDTVMRQAISPKLKLQITLRFGYRGLILNAYFHIPSAQKYNFQLLDGNLYSNMRCFTRFY
ncbi:hypothetical protein ABEB36_015286 [Hypothenemus hampei]|uniref:Uncharacterized protein n=1 Tax=Hypothenemus hampei TaxID=57062 RepID=A0ABD1E4C6_HYPHA